MTKIEARDDPEYLRELCRQALHALETPGDFSTEEFFGLMRDLEIEKLRNGLENCRLFAARNRKEDWALLILGFCAEAGVVGSVTR